MSIADKNGRLEVSYKLSTEEHSNQVRQHGPHSALLQSWGPKQCMGPKEMCLSSHDVGRFSHRMHRYTSQVHNESFPINLSLAGFICNAIDELVHQNHIICGHVITDQLIKQINKHDVYYKHLEPSNQLRLGLVAGCLSSSVCKTKPEATECQNHPRKKCLAADETLPCIWLHKKNAAASEDPLLAQGCETILCMHLHAAQQFHY